MIISSTVTSTAEPEATPPVPDPVEEENRQKGEALFALLEGRDSVIAVPADVVNAQLLVLLVSSTGRILVPVASKDHEPLERVAVRPLSSCRTCNGSTAFRYKATVADKNG